METDSVAYAMQLGSKRKLKSKGWAKKCQRNETKKQPSASQKSVGQKQPKSKKCAVTKELVSKNILTFYFSYLR